MNEADRLNAILEREAPAAFRCLSPVGLRAAFPLGIPAQSTEARGTRLNATVGQVTDGRGQAMPLPKMAQQLEVLDTNKSFLYSPQDGHPDLRDAWFKRQRRLSGMCPAPSSRPIVTLGLTHGVSMVADLFADPAAQVLLPDLSWENYELLFQLRAQAQVRYYPHFRGNEFDVGALADAIAQAPGKAIVVLGFPGNPSGFTPTADQGREIAAVIGAAPGPLVVLIDDAYHGLVYEPGLQVRSMFWEVLERADPERHFVVRVDGATKELFFFPGRVGFISHSAFGEAETALASKIKCMGRGTVGSPPGPSQALVYDALNHGDIDDQIQERVAEMKVRYLALKAAIGGLTTDLLQPYPFNSGLFCVVRLHPSIDADRVRRVLIEEHSVGTVALPNVNGLRIAFCSLRAEDVPEVVARVEQAVESLRR